MTDEQKAALEWLERWSGCLIGEETNRAVATIKAVLAEPRLPAEPSEEALDAIRQACGTTGAISAYHALYAHLRKSQTKTVDVWHVEYAMQVRTETGFVFTLHTSIYSTEAEAREHSEAFSQGRNAYCVRVTGPHKHEVPA
jgi:hypothetical protein